MLTNLDWLEPGKEFPPKTEKERLANYESNELLFLTKHDEVWRDGFAELARRLRLKNTNIDTILNYHQLLSKKTADFVCGEPPKLEIATNGDKIAQLLRDLDFFSRLYEAVIDVSRFGNGILKVSGKKASVASPKCWFPIVSETDLKEITQHVIAFPFARNDKGVPTKLYVEVHDIGSVEIREYSFAGEEGKDAGKIGKLLKKPSRSSTGLDDFAVRLLTNVTCSSSVYGIDDYLIINSIIYKIIWRLHRADNVMDKHSEPSMSGPASALSYDERTKMYFMDLGNYFKRDSSEDPDLKYVTWDGGLESNFKELDFLVNQLYILSEMGAAFLEGSTVGAASSGTALKLRLVSPRIKAARLVGLNDAAVRSVIAMLAKLNGISIDANGLQLIWEDGLPDDPVEDAGRRSTETAGKQVKSVFSAIKERGLSDKDAEAELEQIRLEAAANMPNILATDPTAGDDGDEPIEE